MDPQEKKRLSLKKDCRNTYGENDKSSRKSIRFRKRWVNRSFRRQVNQKIDSSGETEVQDEVASVQRKDWKKCADTPLGEKMLREANWEMEHDLWQASQRDPTFLAALERHLAGLELTSSRQNIIGRRVRAVTLDRGSAALDFSADDLELVAEFLRETTNSEQDADDQLPARAESDAE